MGRQTGADGHKWQTLALIALAIFCIYLLMQVNKLTDGQERVSGLLISRLVDEAVLICNDEAKSSDIATVFDITARQRPAISRWVAGDRADVMALRIFNRTHYCETNFQKTRGLRAADIGELPPDAIGTMVRN